MTLDIIFDPDARQPPSAMTHQGFVRVSACTGKSGRRSNLDEAALIAKATNGRSV